MIDIDLCSDFLLVHLAAPDCPPWSQCLASILPICRLVVRPGVRVVARLGRTGSLRSFGGSWPSCCRLAHHLSIAHAHGVACLHRPQPSRKVNSYEDLPAITNFDPDLFTFSFYRMILMILSGHSKPSPLLEIVCDCYFTKTPHLIFAMSLDSFDLSRSWTKSGESHLVDTFWS